jgi:hypothetical protein
MSRIVIVAVLASIGVAAILVWLRGQFMEPDDHRCEFDSGWREYERADYA